MAGILCIRDIHPCTRAHSPLQSRRIIRRAGNYLIRSGMLHRARSRPVEIRLQPVVVGDMVVWNRRRRSPRCCAPQLAFAAAPCRCRAAMRGNGSGGQRRSGRPVLAAANRALPGTCWILPGFRRDFRHPPDRPDQAGSGRRSPSEIEAIAEEYRAIGYAVVLTSTVTGRGLDELGLLTGRLSALLGKSGVERNLAAQCHRPGLGSAFRRPVKRPARAAIPRPPPKSSLALGGALVDTPGMREFGLWDVDGRDLAWFFPEMRPLLGRCKFGASCRHDEEPGCTIRKAVVEGLISPYRYQSYLKLRAEE